MVMTGGMQPQRRDDYMAGMRKLIRKALAAICLSASPVLAAEMLPLAEVSAYLNGLSTVEASFTQINDDGSVSTGRLYLHRPGRMRFEYDPPDSGVVISAGSTVTVFDPKSNQPPESYPLKRTPLALILARDIDLERAQMVVGHDFDGQSTIVTAQDPEHPEHGRIEMLFGADPVVLSRWVIHDDAGGRTTLILEGMQTGGRIKPSYFTQPTPGSGGRSR
jgi:outer membrane lipoprotein-sorting protein